MHICGEFFHWASEHIMHTPIAPNVSAKLTMLIHCCADSAQFRTKNYPRKPVNLFSLEIFVPRADVNYFLYDFCHLGEESMCAFHDPKQLLAATEKQDFRGSC